MGLSLRSSRCPASPKKNCDDDGYDDHHRGDRDVPQGAEAGCWARGCGLADLGDLAEAVIVSRDRDDDVTRVMSAVQLITPGAAVTALLRSAHHALLRGRAPSGRVLLAERRRRPDLGDRVAEALAQERQLLDRGQLRLGHRLEQARRVRRAGRRGHAVQHGLALRRGRALDEVYVLRNRLAGEHVVAELEAVVEWHRCGQQDEPIPVGLVEPDCAAH